MFQFRNLVTGHRSFTLSLLEGAFGLLHFNVAFLVLHLAFFKLLVGPVQVFREFLGLFNVVFCFLGDFFGFLYKFMLQFIIESLRHNFMLTSLEAQLLQK